MAESHFDAERQYAERRHASATLQADWLASFLSRHWFELFLLLYGLYIALPFLAPVLMNAGLQGAGAVIYWFYSFLCHQLPERSFFLFGPQTTYPLAEIQAAWLNTTNPLVLRQFIGNAEMGWKVAWSDRMVSLFTSIWVFALAWWALRRKLRPLPWWGLVILTLPMAIDGTSHLLSDLAGIGQGFRDSNTWLAWLTRAAVAPAFYSGDAWGSFNSIMRLLTGILFGLGVVWFGFPYLDQAFRGSPISEEKEKL